MLHPSLAAIASGIKPATLLAAVEGSHTPDSFIVGLLLFIGIVFLVIIAIAILLIISYWKIFEKAGKPGWASLIPFYNTAVTIELCRKPMWWIIMMFIPLAGIVFWIILMRRLAAVFGKGVEFTWGMILLPFIFFPILAYGKSVYNNTFPPPPPMSEAVKWSLVALVVFLLIESFGFGFKSDIRSHVPSEPLKILDADNGYATDGTYVYQYDMPIKGADPDSFKIVDQDYATDDYHVYFNGKEMVGADPDTFKVVPDEGSSNSDYSGYYAADKDHVYAGRKTVTGADPASFVGLSYGYGKDSSQVYFLGNVVTEADPVSFETLGGEYDAGANYDAKDKFHYYLEGKITTKK